MDRQFNLSPIQLDPKKLIYYRLVDILMWEQAADWRSIDKSLATSKPTEPTEVSEITEETNLFSNTS